MCIYLADIRSGVYSSGFHNPVNAGYFLVDVDNRLFSAQHSPLYRHGGFIDKTSIKMDEGARSIYFFCCTWYFQVTVGKGRPLARQTRSKSVPSCSWCCDGPFSCWSMVAGTALGRTARQPNPRRTGTDTCPTKKKEREKKRKTSHNHQLIICDIPEWMGYRRGILSGTRSLISWNDIQQRPRFCLIPGFLSN